MRYARLRATSPTYGAVTLIVVSEPREEQLMSCALDTANSGPRRHGRGSGATGSSTVFGP